MDDPKPNSPSDEPSPESQSEAGVAPVELTPVDGVGPGEPAPIEPRIRPLEPPAPQYELAEPAKPAPIDGLTGDAAPVPIVPAYSRPGVRPGDTLATVGAEPTSTPVPSPRSGSFSRWTLIYVLVWTCVMATLLNHRFDRRFDWNTSYFSIVARNLNTLGFRATHGGMYLVAGDRIPLENREFYAGHPPLTAWLLAGWMRAFGQFGHSDFVIRALPLTFSALNLLLLYALVRRVFGAPAALATVIVCSMLPMTAYYAQVVNMEPFVMTFLLGASLGYLAWARSGSTLGFLLLCVCVVLGCWTDWPMYVFTGLLAVTHFFRRRDLLTPLPGAAGEEEPTTPARPFVSSLLLIVLPMAVFLAFLFYLHENGAPFSDLTDRATARMTANQEGYVKPSRLGGYELLLQHFRRRAELQDWFVNLLNPAALLLAALGAIFWAKWSRRLSLASGEAARRAAFRIVLCVVVMQVVYTLAFPQGAWKHEFWQYYLIVPVALLAAAFCTWLTVAGGVGRRFSAGLVDRAAWAVAALIPLAAVGPFAYRMQVLGKTPPNPETRLNADYAGALAANTRPDDVILTDSTEDGLGFALPWYTNRAILPHTGVDADPDARDTHSLEGIARAAARFKGHRVLYLWADEGPEKLFEELTRRYPRHAYGSAIVYTIAEADAVPAAPTTTTTAPSAGGTSVTPSTSPAATAPSTKPAAATP